MIFIKTVLGNIGDREWADRLSAAESDLLEIDQWEAQKSRFRKTTAKGVEIAVSIDRGTHIRDGDVLPGTPRRARQLSRESSCVT